MEASAAARRADGVSRFQGRDAEHALFAKSPRLANTPGRPGAGHSVSKHLRAGHSAGRGPSTGCVVAMHNCKPTGSSNPLLQ